MVQALYTVADVLCGTLSWASHQCRLGVAKAGLSILIASMLIPTIVIGLLAVHYWRWRRGYCDW